MIRKLTLTAITAFALGLSGAVAQDDTTTDETTTEEPQADAAPAEETTTEEAPTEEPAAEEETATEDATDEEPAATEETATEEAPAEDATEEAAAEAEAADEEMVAEEEAVADEEMAAEEEMASEEAADEAMATEEHADEEHSDAGGHGGAHIEDVAFSFEGPFGTYDQQQLQRGLKVYMDVCRACHGLQYVPIRTLTDLGYSEDEVRAFAAENLEVFDAELDDYRPALPRDNFPSVSGEGMGPDLSLMAKARAGFHGPAGTGLAQLFKGMGGPEYITSFLTGFTGEEREVAGQYLYENTAFDGGWVSMPPQLSDGLVEFDDGHANDAHHIAEDVSAFLMWTAEPKMMQRKQAGFIGVIMLIILSSMLYLTNKKLWAPHKYGKDMDL